MWTRAAFRKLEFLNVFNLHRTELILKSAILWIQLWTRCKYSFERWIDENSEGDGMTLFQYFLVEELPRDISVTICSAVYTANLFGLIRHVVLSCRQTTCLISVHGTSRLGVREHNKRRWNETTNRRTMKPNKDPSVFNRRAMKFSFCEIWNFHDGDYEECRHGVVWVLLETTFRRNVSAPS
jgi:hypothetical protein